MRGIPQGLYFIHTSLIKYHGFLCLQNCLVDSNWNVKLTNFVTEEVVADKLRHNELKYFTVNPPSKKKKGKKEKQQVEKNSDESENEASDESDNVLEQQQRSMLEKSDKNAAKSKPPPA